MSVDTQTVRRVAKLARIAVEEKDLEPLAGELNGILDLVEQLKEVDVDGVDQQTNSQYARQTRNALFTTINMSTQSKP